MPPSASLGGRCLLPTSSQGSQLAETPAPRCVPSPPPSRSEPWLGEHSVPARGAPDEALFSVPLVRRHKGSGSSELGPYLNDLLIAVVGLDALGRQRVTVARPVGHHGEGFPHGLQDTERAGTETGPAGTAPPASCTSAEERAAPSTAQGTHTEALNGFGEELPGSASPKHLPPPRISS